MLFSLEYQKTYKFHSFFMNLSLNNFDIIYIEALSKAALLWNYLFKECNMRLKLN